jgi:hypothetical protein
MPHVPCTVQEYIYSFRYGEEGVEFEMAATAHGKKKDKYNSKNKVGTQPVWQLGQLLSQGWE